MNIYQLFGRAYYSKNPIWKEFKLSPRTVITKSFSSPVVLVFDNDLQAGNWDHGNPNISWVEMGLARHLIGIYPEGFSTARGDIGSCIGEAYHWRYEEQHLCRSRIREIRRIGEGRVLIIAHGK